MFKKALLFDSWMFPIRQEAEALAAASKKNPVPDVYFVNCQRFQSAKNVATIRHFEDNNNVVTLRDTLHYAPVRSYSLTHMS